VDISQILQARFPGKKWALSGNEYSGLEWLDDSKKPTEKELANLWPEVENEFLNKTVEASRQLAYREESDPIFFRWQRGEATEQDWLLAVETVKNKFPKKSISG